MELQYLNKAASYEQGRLGYSEECITLMAELISPCSAKIADIGCGTGLFSKMLLDAGYTVYGVEPDKDLQEKAQQNIGCFKGFSSAAGTAENTGLPHNSVNAITAASAFHWFNTQAFLQECKRILKPDGLVFLLYNVRKTDDLLSKEQERICRQYCPKFVSFHHGADKAKSCCPEFFSDNYKEVHYPYDLIYTKEKFLSRCLSSSYSPGIGQPDYSDYRRALEELIEDYSVNNLITISNHTVIWYGKIS